MVKAQKKKEVHLKPKSEMITRTDPFAAVVKAGPDGKKWLYVKSLRWYRFQISKFKEGDEVTLEVHSKKPKRTEAQNRYYFGVYLPLVSAETGESDINKLHELFKGKFLTEEVAEVLGQKVRIKKSTTELNVGEFCKYIMDIEAETRVQAPPTENYGLAPLQRESEVVAGYKYPEEELTPLF